MFGENRLQRRLHCSGYRMGPSHSTQSIQRAGWPNSGFLYGSFVAFVIRLRITLLTQGELAWAVIGKPNGNFDALRLSVEPVI